MSGHSKWANIKRKKEATDTKRAGIFSKLGKELTVAVKMGGSPDPNVNRKLKDVIAKCKANNMPNDNINRCIQKAAGEGSGANYEEITYEGYGPCGVAVIVEATTDNKNRTAADVRHIFSKAGGSLGVNGAVGYMFEKKGYILVEKTEGLDEDELMMTVLDAGADDFVPDEEYIEIFTSPDAFSDVLDAVEQAGVSIVESDVRQIASMKKELNEEEEEKMQKFLDALDDNDDVQNVWHNADM